jgi:ABC-type nitrate/sulfonate/bicarbonate transport system substrate-binding protein
VFEGARWFFWVRADSVYKWPKDLKGAKIGLVRLGGAAHALGQAVVKALDIERQVRFVGTGGIGSSIAALKTGKIDASVNPLEVWVELKLKGQVRELLMVDDFLPRPWSGEIIFVHKSFLTEGPSTIGKTLRGISDALEFIAKNRAWSIAEMKKLSNYSEEAADMVYKRLVSSKGVKLDPKALANVRNFLIEYGVVPKEKMPPLEDMWTNRFTG